MDLFPDPMHLSWVAPGTGVIKDPIEMDLVSLMFDKHMNLFGVKNVTYEKVKLGLSPATRAILVRKKDTKVLLMRFLESLPFGTIMIKDEKVHYYFLNQLATFDFNTMLWHPHAPERAYKNTEVPILLYRLYPDQKIWTAERMPLQYPIGKPMDVPDPDTLLFKKSFPYGTVDAMVIFPGYKAPNFVHIDAEYTEDGDFADQIRLDREQPLNYILFGHVSLESREVTVEILGPNWSPTYTSALYEPKVDDETLFAWNTLVGRFNEHRVLFFRPRIEGFGIDHRYLKVSWINLSLSRTRTYNFVSGMPIQMRTEPGRAELALRTDPYVEDPVEFDKQNERGKISKEIVDYYMERITNTVDSKLI